MHIMKHISQLNEQYNKQYKCTSKVDKQRHKQSVGYIKYVFTKWLRVDEQVIKWHLLYSNGAIKGNFASNMCSAEGYEKDAEDFMFQNF